MAAMSVIGIDLGNESCYIAVAKAGGIETIANDYSLRSTPSYVAFSGKNRILGVAAKNQQVTNMKNTVYGLKRLLGRKFRDPQVQKELKMLPYAAVEGPNGDIQIQVNYLDEEHHFSPEQCLAMVFTKLKEVSTDALQTPINDCVISVPSYFTNNERRALLDSATVAGLNVLRLFNETTATALSYGIYKQDLPGTEEKPRHVIFVDCGQSSLQVFACAFHKGKLRMLATSSDRDLGGRDIDYVLADHIAKDFQVKYKIDAKSNARAYVRLLAEVEKLKKQMSANSTTLPLNIECFMNDKDVHSEMKRADMEQLCGHMFDRVELVLTDCLKKSGLALDDIYAVEVVGGSTRIPFIKQLIEKVYKKVASTTLNQDESVSRGCALQCAMLSPAVRVRDFSVTDVQSYPVIVSWDSSRDGEQSGEIEVFPLNHAVPFSKMLTFYRQESFELRATYNCPIPYPDPNIGTWIIKDVKPSAEGKAQKVKVKVRINLNGIITVSSASLVESKESNGSDSNGAGQPMDGLETSGGATDGTAGDKDGGSNHTGEGTGDSGTAGEKGSDGATAPAEGTEANTTEATAEEGEDKKDKKKKVSKSTDLPIEAILFGYSQSEINGFTEQEFKMIAGDRQEKERADARNALEEYVYELRGKLSGEDELAPFLLESDRDLLIRQLEDMENWLYEEGEDCSRAVYQEKLADLKGKGEPIQLRRLEFELRPPVIEGFQRSLQLANKAVEQIRSNEAKYAHLTEDEAAQVAAQVTSSYQWLEETRQKIVAAPKHLSPPVTVAQIRHERQSFESATNQILNKPAPKAASPPKDAKPTAAAATDEQSTNQDSTDASKSQDKMDTS